MYMFLSENHKCEGPHSPTKAPIRRGKIAALKVINDYNLTEAKTLSVAPAWSFTK